MGNTLSFKREFGFIVVGAIIFTASLLWKDVIVEIEEIYFPKTEGVGSRLLYTVVVTILLVLLAVHIKGILGLNTPLPTDINQLSDVNFSEEPIDYTKEK